MGAKELQQISKDTEVFLNRLQYKYNIRYKRQSANVYYGEFISQKGEYYTINIHIGSKGTKVEIAKEGRQVVYQKDYITNTDKKSLSKSIGVDKFIERVIV